MKFSTKGYCKTSRPRKIDGYCPLYLIIKPYLKRETLISTGKYIDPLGFNNKIGFYEKSSDPINRYLRNELGKIDEIIFLFDKVTAPITMEMIKGRYLNSELMNNFCDYAEETLKSFKKVLHPPTYLGYETGIKRLVEYAPNVTFSEIDLVFLEEYKSYLINVKKRKLNGIYQVFASIRRVWYHAMKKGLVTSNPFDGFVMPREKTKKNYLDKTELLRVYDLWASGELPPDLHSTIWYFLISCFTGIRLNDVRILSRNMFRDELYLSHFIDQHLFRVNTSKSRFRKEAKITITSKLKKLLQHPAHIPIKYNSDRNNKDIRKVIAQAGIDKHVSFHAARHTYGVVSTQLGVSSRVIQENMTHSESRTTDTYRSIVEDFRSTESEKWNDL